MCTASLTDANVSIGPMHWCNYCQQNVGGAIKHEAGCKALVDASVSPERLDNDQLNRIIARGMAGTESYQMAYELKALRERCERMEKALNPRAWDMAMDIAWHRAIPDLNKAFSDLREAALQPLSERDKP